MKHTNRLNLFATAALGLTLSAGCANLPGTDEE